MSLHHSRLKKEVVQIDDDSSPSWLGVTRGGGAKLLAALLGLALYAYLLMFLKTAYLRQYRIEELNIKMQKTAEMIENLNALNQRLATTVQKLAAAVQKLPANVQHLHKNLP